MTLPMASERSTTYVSPQGPLSLAEKIRMAHARVRNAKVLYELFPTQLYRVALGARQKELDDLLALRKPRC